MLFVPNGTPLIAGSVSAPVTAIATPFAATHPRRQAAERHLDRGELARVGDEPVGQGVRAAIGGTGTAHPHVGQARPAEVLDQRQRAGAQDLQCRSWASSHRPELHPHARGQQRGLLTVDVPQRRLALGGASDQLPAARATRGDTRR